MLEVTLDAVLEAQLLEAVFDEFLAPQGPLRLIVREFIVDLFSFRSYTF